MTLLVLWSQTATDEYIEREDARFQQAADLLLRGLAPAPGQAASSVASSLRLGEQHTSLSGDGDLLSTNVIKTLQKLASLLEKKTALQYKRTRKELCWFGG